MSLNSSAGTGAWLDTKCPLTPLANFRIYFSREQMVLFKLAEEFTDIVSNGFDVRPELMANLPSDLYFREALAKVLDNS
jgi:hypothetical protein